MSTRTAVLFARSIWTLSSLFAATALAIIVLGVSVGVSFLEFGAAFNTAAIAAAFSTVGAVVASHRSRNAIGWIMCAGGLGSALGSVTDAYAVYAILGGSEEPMPGAALSAWTSLWISSAGINAFSLLVLLFPDGRLPSKRWRPIVWLVVFAMVAEGVYSAFLTDRFGGYGGISNPYHVVALDPLGDAYTTYAQAPLTMLAMILPSVALVARFRRLRGVQRQQLKWFVSSVVLVALGVGSILAVFIFFGEDSFRSQLLLTVCFAFTTLALCSIPISMGVAILKYRLYDIDLLINRTLVYASLTVVLAVSYEGGIVTLQHVFRTFTGQGSEVAVVASTLAIAALFEPLRRRIQGFIDRRFYRRKYDATKTVAAFLAKLRQETDLDALSADLVGVVEETIQPAHVSLWLRSDVAARDEQ